MGKVIHLAENPLYDALIFFLNKKFDGRYRNLTISYKNSSRKRVRRDFEDFGKLAYLDTYFEIGNYAPSDIYDPEFPEKWREEYLEYLGKLEKSSEVPITDLLDMIGYWDVNIYVNFNTLVEEELAEVEAPASALFDEDEGGEEEREPGDGYYERGEINYVTIKIALVR